MHFSSITDRSFYQLKSNPEQYGLFLNLKDNLKLLNYKYYVLNKYIRLLQVNDLDDELLVIEFSRAHTKITGIINEMLVLLLAQRVETLSDLHADLRREYHRLFEIQDIIVGKVSSIMVITAEDRRVLGEKFR